jgi:hypothetical protein
VVLRFVGEDPPAQLEAVLGAWQAASA